MKDFEDLDRRVGLGMPKSPLGTNGPLRTPGGPQKGPLQLVVPPRDSHENPPTKTGGTQTPEFYIGKTIGMFKDKSGTL